MKTLIKNTFTTYNNTVNLITHIVERHFSILNKFKHLLVFGTLALSLNVTSGDVNQFNKQAYLDLNTEYDWNQPQSYYRKDNQATTLLKETVGIIHGAVGSTDSDNVNQLSDKITTGIQSQIRNRAINDTIRKTEDMINNKANELANRFGAGRTEISISGIASQDLQYSIKTIQPIYPLDKNNKELVFFHGQFTLGENHGEHRNITNLGIGKRFLLESGRSIAGINLFGDYEAKSEHRRLGFGLEYIRTNFSTHLNTYHSLSDKKIIGGYTEEVLAGYDVKLSGQAPYLPWAKIKGTYYYWDAKAGANIKGNIFGIEIGVSPSTRFEFGTENSSIADRVNYMQLSVALPISKNDKFTNFFIDNKPFRAIGIMNLNDLHYVERTNKIRIEKVLNAIFTINAIADAEVTENTAFTGSRPSLSNAPIGKLIYTLGGADAAGFSIDSSTGIISMVARDFEVPADANTDNVYEITIIATDVDNNTDSETQTVTVTDVTETATFTINPIADARVAENTAFTGSRPSLSGNTPIGRLIYTLGGADAAGFSIDSSTGIISMVARDFEVPADANTDNIYEVTIIATDVDNNTDSETQTVTVTDAAETATFTINPIADARITENTAFTGSRPSLSGDTPIGKLTYTLGGADAADFSIDSSTGIISMVARDFGVPDDANIDNVYEVIIIATDVDNNTDSETQTVAITFVSETILFKGLTYKTIASPDRNRVWLDRNLGATRVATSSTDSAAYGHLYQWGRNDDGHEDRTNANTSTTLANGIIDAGTTLFIKKTFIPYDWTRADSSGAARSSAWEVDGTNNVCPAGFSVPTEADMNADTLSAITTKIINKAVAFSSFLKLPVAGFRFSEHGLFGSVGNYGHYWTRSTEGTRTRTLDFRDDQAYFHGNYRAHGVSVRCIKG